MNKPLNLIFILADDLGWVDLSSQGSTFYETPHLDRLATGGMRFTNGYAAAPVCSPTRASLLTGKYPARMGTTQYFGGRAQGRLQDVAYIDHLTRGETSLASALRDGGYQTWHVGKWHLGGQGFLPEDHGFDQNVGGCHMGAPGTAGYFAPWDIPVLENGKVEPGTHLDDYLFDRAMSLIGERDHPRPFLLNLWPYSVHTPIEADERLVEKYRRKAQRMGLDCRQALVAGERFPCDHKRDKRVVRRIVQSDPTYAAMLETLDRNVGRLIAHLDELRLTESTMVVFTSDNGGLATAEGSPTCNAPLSEGKGWMYEGGTRTPWFVSWPGVVRPGTQCDEPVTSPDLYPTLLEAAGLALRPDQHTDGLSLLPLLRGESTLNRDAIYWHYPHYGNQGSTPTCGLRAGRYKFIRFFESDRTELYDLQQDPGEHFNLVEQEPTRAEGFGRMLDRWLNEMNASIPQTNPDYVPIDDPLAHPLV